MRGIRIGENHLGRAVYAERAFAPGDLIGTVRGRVVDDAEFSTPYSIDLGGTFSLDPGPPFRFLNHCCSPNAELLLTEPARPRRTNVMDVRIYARKRIRPGEELTIDYAWPADAAIPCGCGSRWCRGWVVARSQRKYVQSPPVDVFKLLEPAAAGAVPATP